MVSHVCWALYPYNTVGIDGVENEQILKGDLSSLGVEVPGLHWSRCILPTWSNVLPLFDEPAKPLLHYVPTVRQQYGDFLKIHQRLECEPFMAVSDAMLAALRRTDPRLQSRALQLTMPLITRPGIRRMKRIHVLRPSLDLRAHVDWAQTHELFFTPSVLQGPDPAYCSNLVLNPAGLPPRFVGSLPEEFPPRSKEEDRLAFGGWKDCLFVDNTTFHELLDDTDLSGWSAVPLIDGCCTSIAPRVRRRPTLHDGHSAGLPYGNTSKEDAALLEHDPRRVPEVWHTVDDFVAAQTTSLRTYQAWFRDMIHNGRWMGGRYKLLPKG